jgi:transcriptional regulator with XRE-family HTH domain
MSKRESETKRFGEAVRRARLRTGLTQEELADRCGLDRSYIGGVERGERNPTLVVIEKIAAGLDIPLRRLFSQTMYEEGGA